MGMPLVEHALQHIATKYSTAALQLRLVTLRNDDAEARGNCLLQVRNGIAHKLLS